MLVVVLVLIAGAVLTCAGSIVTIIGTFCVNPSKRFGRKG